jgi:hypothetical protein
MAIVFYQNNSVIQSLFLALRSFRKILAAPPGRQYWRAQMGQVAVLGSKPDHEPLGQAI